MGTTSIKRLEPGTRQIENFKLEITGKKNLRFNGELLAKGDTKRNGSSTWKNYALFRTVGSVYILYCENITIWQGEQDKYEVLVRGSREELQSWYDNEERIHDSLKVMLSEYIEVDEVIE